MSPVSWQAISGQTETYQVLTDVYEGPLDLLLDLIERAELDITTLSLAKVTDQYLEYMHKLQEKNVAEVSSFLVIAAKLVQIKSQALLPKPPLPPIEGEEEDAGEALTRQLIIYKRFKEIGLFLATQFEKRRVSFLRLAPPPRRAGKVDLSDVTLLDLLAAAHEAFLVKKSMQPLSQIVGKARITIRERIHQILLMIRELETITFREILTSDRSRLSVVVTFLAMLELIKRQIISVQQETLFSDIFLFNISQTDVLDEDQIEFKD
jgi:segregation and condensation protein A